MYIQIPKPVYTKINTTSQIETDRTWNIIVGTQDDQSGTNIVDMINANKSHKNST